jgi:hypothetical protein
MTIMVVWKRITLFPKIFSTFAINGSMPSRAEIHPRLNSGGATLYLPEDAPSQSKGVLNKILGEGDSGKDQEGGSEKKSP